MSNLTRFIAFSVDSLGFQSVACGDRHPLLANVPMTATPANEIRANTFAGYTWETRSSALGHSLVDRAKAPHSSIYL